MRMTIKNLFTRWYSRQRRLYGIFSALMFLVIITSPTNVWAAYSGSGSGTSEDPYLVTSEAQLTEVLGTCGGYAKLTANFLNSTNVYNIQVNTTVTLDLNGKTIENYYTSANNQYYHSYDIFIINSGANLTITDNSSEKNGTIKCADGPKGAFHNKGTLTILGGIITQNSGNVGGGIYNDDGAVLTISGGTISENSYYGIYNAFGATCNITGGTITNNGSSGNGGICNLGTLNISGAPNISGNRSYNIYLPTGKTITVAGALSNTTPIGITMQTPGDFTNEYAGAYTHFVSDNTDYEVINTAENKASLRSCWAGLNVLLSQGGIISLSKDYKAVSTDGHLLVESGKTVTLDLNGHTLNRNLGSAVNEGCVIKNQGTLIINGTGGGVITGGFSSSGGGGILNEGTLTINGGTIKENKTTSLGAGIYNVTGKTLTLNGGVIYNNQNTTDDGGGIYNQGTFTLTSGSITNNKVTGTTKNGGGIYNNGTIFINGGTIQNNTATGLGAGIYHDGTAFNLQGSPTISSNTVNSSPKNVYLTAAHPTITITGDLTNTTKISLNMESLGVFTSGLSGFTGTYDNFSSEAGNAVALVDNTGEAELITYWNYLNRQIKTDGSYTLESGKVYEAGSSDSYLHVPSGRTVVLYLNGRTLNRNVGNTAIASGCVILNEGTLTINGTAGSITGGNNDDSNEIKGGGICNKGTLTYEIGTIGNNKTATLGGGIYNTGTLTIKGGTINNNTASGNTAANGIYHDGSQFNLEGNPNINVYLATGKTITISNTLSNTNPINIATADDYIIFTSGLSGKGDASKFTANQDGKGIGLNSAGEAILGTSYAITRQLDATGTTSYLYIKGNHYNAMTAVYGERVKVQITTSGVPMSLNYPGAPPSYPKAGVDYEFDMPSEAVTVTAKCRPGGYCGASNLEDIKWAIDDGTLTFITKDETTDYSMASYNPGESPWFNKSYTSVLIPKKLAAISDFAFCDNTKNLTTFTVEAGNTAFKVESDLLFSNDGYTLYCYPSGKTNATTYTLPSGVTTVKDGAFAFNTTLQNIAVAGGTNYKATDGVLYNNTGTSLICYPAGKEGASYTIAATVAEIKPYAFQSCSNLDYVYVLRSTPITTGNIAMFDDVKSSFKILVPSGVLSDYKAAAYWFNYQNIIYAIDGDRLEITLTTDKDAYDYFGSPVKPDVTQVRSTAGDGKVLVIGVDYDATYTYTNNNAIGTGTVQVTGIGNYAGITATKDFDITKKVEIAGATGRYSTYYHAEAVILTVPDGLTAYTITSVDWNAGTTELSGALSYIPPSTPVLLYKSSGNCNGTYHLKKVDSGSVEFASDFKGKSENDADRSYASLSAGFKAIYVLKGEKFYRATSGELGANRCYLAEPNAGAGSRGLSVISIGDGDGTTGINTLPNDDGEDMSGNWYTLDGRKLQGKPTQKGVYISNGKKMVIK